jgi:hypothetical protein
MSVNHVHTRAKTKLATCKAKVLNKFQKYISRDVHFQPNNNGVVNPLAFATSV